MEPSANGHGSETSGPIVPRAILRRHDLRSTDKLVLAFVSDMAAYFSRSGGDFRMSHQRMAEELGMEDREVRRSVRKLYALGLLLEEKRPGKTTILRPTPPSKSGVPRRLSPDTPPFKSDHPAVEVRGTPPFKSDELTTVTNSNSERVERTEQPPEPFRVEAEETRIRISWSRAFEESTKQPCYMKPRDVETIRQAANLGTCRPWPTTTDLRLELSRTIAGLKKRSMQIDARNAINHIGESWEDRAHKSTAQPPGPSYEDFTGRAQELLMPLDGEAP